ncbi:Uncharacterised protein [Streptococcus criceti]|uniref:Uncharacterized protein n=1 Tax=Streptococcus criceti HS-6 TaxID=873449 RepID=G5JP39_STRCG|nr:hypothetical protein [Streptococcus criceti]EHI74874.1 hypothetical protein STRCR_0271 [Streptococcus criceti HS-6]SUN41765.1 Uncharacterised protein [Streptococcus criceti]
MQKTGNYKWPVLIFMATTTAGIAFGVFASLGFNRPLAYFVLLAAIIGDLLGLWGLRYQLRKDREANHT